jgi:MFS family permease
MPIIGGIFFDKLGIRIGLILFTSIVCIGQGIFAIGGYKKSFNLLLIGRVIFGIGCEAMIVGQSAVTSAWFLNFELPFAMSMIVCFPLLGSFIQGAVIPSVYEESGFGWAFVVGLILCIVSLIMVIIIALMDKYARKADDAILDEYVEEICETKQILRRPTKDRIP